MKISIDLRSETPIYLQIVEQVHQQVADGTLIPDFKLPTVRALASDLRINFNTVSRAYHLLDESGIISTQQGRGTYILEMHPSETSELLRMESLGVLAHRYLDQVKRLGFTTEQAINRLQDEVQQSK